MYQFFDKLGYPVSVVQAGHHRAQPIDRQSALQTAEKDNTFSTQLLTLNYLLSDEETFFPFDILSWWHNTIATNVFLLS